MKGEPLVFVLRHTHWDREWYHPAPVFRKRLVDLIDGLLGESLSAPFLLDGQAIVLRDYLAVRPERAAELSAAMHAGRLEAGPWFVLPDELIPGGEALVRNLLAGRRVLRALRVTPPAVLYCPDSFGHPAALPAIAAGFGYSTIVLWRGYGSRRHPKGDAAQWVAPGGESALLFHLPADGYEFGSNLPADDEGAARRWNAIRAELEPRSSLGILLVPNGADHHALQPEADAAVAALARVAAPRAVQVGGLGAFAAAVETRAVERALPKVSGELRDSYGYTWTLQGTFASRAYQKRANAQIERLLTRDVEPWVALARFNGAASARHHVNAAWETLLATHPHDSLCGCSIDSVAAAVDTRMAAAGVLAGEIREAAIATLLGHEPNVARANQAAWQTAVVVRNRAARPRAGVAEVDVDVALAHVPVGPGSASGRRAIAGPDTLGVPSQLLSREKRYSRLEAPSFYPINFEVERRRVLVWLPAVPAYGTVALPMTADAAFPQVPEEAAVSATTRGVRNTSTTLTIGRSGVMIQRGSDSRAFQLVDLEIERDNGDLYTASLVPNTRARAKLRKSRITARGPLRGVVQTSWRATTRGRAETASVAIETSVALDAGSEFVRVLVRGTNTATDHRLRIVLHTRVKPRRVLADAAFALVERKKLRVPAADQKAELVPSTDPLHRFVSLFDGSRGCTVVSDGLAEYEVTDDGDVAVTLVRAVGQLSRNDLPERPGHAGWPEATPAGQCVGPFAAEFAVAWHAGDNATTRARIIDLVDDALLPLTGSTHRDLVTLPPPVRGVSLAGDGLAFSTFKESEDGRGLIARCINVTDTAVSGIWTLPQPVSRAHSARLDETPLEPLEPRGHSLPFVVPPRGISTVYIELADAPR